MLDMTFAPDTLAWMAGLLEGEGYFFYNSRIGVRLAMTDEDVVARFASLWGVNYWPLKRRESHHKVPYLAALPAKKAVQCMRLVLPFCGARRAATIERCLATYEQDRTEGRARSVQAHLHISDEALAQAWRTRDPNISFRAFCRGLNVNGRQTTLRRLTRLGLISGESLAEPAARSVVDEALDWAVLPEQVKLAWVAGLLEGEGSFPRKGSCSYVSLQMTDEDVVSRYADLVSARYAKVDRPRKANWSQTYYCQLSGDNAAALMERILPLMGERRSAKIREGLAVRAAYKVLFASQQAEYKVARETKLPAAELTQRWTTRVAPENLSSFAREYGVHPQIMKERLIALGIYSVAAYKPCTDVTHTCASCSTPFVRKASTQGGQYCSRVCSGRAAQQRRRENCSQQPA